MVILTCHVCGGCNGLLKKIFACQGLSPKNCTRKAVWKGREIAMCSFESKKMLPRPSNRTQGLFQIYPPIDAHIHLSANPVFFLQILPLPKALDPCKIYKLGEQ